MSIYRPEYLPPEVQELTGTQSKVNLVNLDRVTEGLPIIKSPYEQLQASKGNILGFVRAERIQSKEQGFDTPFIHTYKEYLTALRKVRLEQKQALQEATPGSTEYSDPSRYYPASLLDKKGTNYSPVVAQRLLKNFSKKYDHVINDEDINSIVIDPVLFYKKMQVFIKLDSNIVFDNIPSLQLMFTPEYIRNLINEISNNYYSRVVQHFDELAEYFTPEEQKATLNFIMNNGPTLSLTHLHHSYLATFFTPEELKKNIYDAATHKHYPINSTLIDPYIEKGILTVEEVKGIINKRIENLSVLNEFSTLLKYYSSEEIAVLKQKVVDTYLDSPSDDPPIFYLDISDSFLSLEDNRLIAKKSILSNPIMTVSQEEQLTKLFEPTELRKLFLEAITDDLLISLNDPDSVYYLYRFIQEQFFTEQDKQNLVHRLINLKSTDNLIEYIDSAIAVFPEDKRAEIAKSIVDLADIKNAVNKPDELVKYLSVEDLQKLAEKALRSPEIDVTDILNNIYRLLHYIPAERQHSFIQKLVTANPPLALGYFADESDFFARLNINKQTIFELALSDIQRLQFAPKALQALYKKLSREITEENFQNLANEGFLIYNNINLIKSRGLEDPFYASFRAQQLTPTQEKELLLSYRNLIKMSEDLGKDFTTDDCFGLSYEATQSKLFSKFSKLLGQESEYTPDEINRFTNMMESPIPLLTYALQYYKSTDHQTVIREIFNSILKGNYSEWKYGLPTPEAIEEFKTKKLLPENLTFDQYTSWRGDEQTSFYESLATDTNAISKNIQDYMSNNLEHLEVTSTLDEIMDKYPDVSTGVQSQLGEIGQELAGVNKKLSNLRKTENPDPEEIQKLEEGKAELESKRQRYLRVRKIIRLMNIRPEEIAAGCLLEGKDAKNKGDQINSVLDDLKRTSSGDNAFIYDTVRTFINDLQNQNKERQNIVCTDSSNPKVMIEIGDKPVGSCQNYEDGSMNQCLLGYSEPNTKILVVRNEKGAIIARSIFRLLESKYGNPTLHIELIYSSSTSQAVNKIIYTHALRKSQTLNMPLYVSSQSQNESGILVNSKVPSGFKTEDTEETISIKAIRAPFVYVDSAGGQNSEEGYTMTDLKKIT